MKVAITGATGFLGQNLIRLLESRGVGGYCLVRPSSNLDLLKGFPFTPVSDAFQNVASLHSVLSKVDYLFHCAAMVGTSNKATQKMLNANVDLTTYLLKALEQHPGCRLVYCSTIATCAVSENGIPVDETVPWNLDRYNLDGGYTTTKKKAEDEVLSAAGNSVDTVVVNPCYMLGPNDTQLSSNRLILDIIKRKIPAFPPGCNNFVDVRDVAIGMLLAAIHGQRGQRYILGGQNLTYKQLFDKVSTLSHSKPICKPLSNRLASILARLGDVAEAITGKPPLFNSTGMAWSFANCCYTSEKAIHQLGYHPGHLDQAISDSIEWFRDNQYL